MPVCHDCSNGVCTGPNVCECHAGYIHINSIVDNETTCEAICPHCEHPNLCESPYKCECDLGYSEDQHTDENGQSATICRPDCETKCGFGHCSANNTCECDHGYHLRDDVCVEAATAVCVCDNGQCDNGECVCNPEYTKSPDGLCEEVAIFEATTEHLQSDIVCHGDSCSTVCIPGCENAICMANNSCECEDGFDAHPEHSHICEPHCDVECVHGICVAPHRCECHQGFMLQQDNYTCSMIGSQHELTSPHSDGRHSVRTYLLTLFVILFLVGAAIAVAYYIRLYSRENEYVLNGKGSCGHNRPLDK